MRVFLARLITVISCFSLVACTTMRPVSLPAGAATPGGVKAEDTVRVRLVSGGERELIVSRVDESALEGVDPASKAKVTIAKHEIASVERKELDGARTAAWTIGILLGLAVWGLSAAHGAVKTMAPSAALP